MKTRPLTFFAFPHIHRHASHVATAMKVTRIGVATAGATVSCSPHLECIHKRGVVPTQTPATNDELMCYAPASASPALMSLNGAPGIQLAKLDRIPAHPSLSWVAKKLRLRARAREAQYLDDMRPGFPAGRPAMGT